MPENNDLNRVQTYRELVLRYEALHAQINSLLHAHQGASEHMSPDELTHYRQLARQRDELFNEMRWMEQELLSDDTTDSLDA